MAFTKDIIDFNGKTDSEIVDILDAVQLINFILGVTNFDFIESYLADCNADNIINIQDVIIIVNYIINMLKVNSYINLYQYFLINRIKFPRR